MDKNFEELEGMIKLNKKLATLDEEYTEVERKADENERTLQEIIKKINDKRANSANSASPEKLTALKKQLQEKLITCEERMTILGNSIFKINNEMAKMEGTIDSYEGSPGSTHSKPCA